MKRALSILAVLAAPALVLAQIQSLQPCASEVLDEILLQKDPDFAARRGLFEKELLDRAENSSATAGQRTTHIVPVVVHIVAPPGTPIGQGNNLTDAEVEAGLALLNAAFANDGPFLAPNGTSTGISFCLARQDPDGKPTNGITRDYSALVADTGTCAGFGTSLYNANLVKYLNDWDCARYANIWLVTDIFDFNLGCGVNGFAYYPGSPCSVDGVVMEGEIWNKIGGAQVAAHEMGHYFNLYHTFHGGCGNTYCLTQGDRVCDTPPDDSGGFAPCDTNSCHSDLPDLPDDNTNHMDYSACLPRHFTDGQGQRMRDGLEVGRAGLLNSTLCEPVAGLDVAILSVEIDTGCLSRACPTILVKNNGLSTLTNIDFNSMLDNGAPVGHSWTGLLLPDSSTVVKLPCVDGAAGDHELFVEAILVNNGADQFTDNNIVSIPVKIEDMAAVFNSVTSSLTATFINTSTGATSHSWNFGDGQTSTEANPSHTYAVPGTYVVHLTVASGCGTAESSQIVVISGACAGPVADLPFTGDMYDVSGNFNNASPGGQGNFGPELTEDRFGNPNSAYRFGGFNQKNWMKIYNSPSLQFDKQMSLSMWFRQCSFKGMNEFGQFDQHGYHILFAKAGDGISTQSGFYSRTGTDATGTMRVEFKNTNAAMTVDTTVTCFDTCEWVHFALVVDYSTVKIYLNGKLQKTLLSPNVNFTNANGRDLYFGRMFGGGTIWYPFNGVMDDIKIYKCALTEKEVQALFGNFVDTLHYDPPSIDIQQVAVKTNPCSAGPAHAVTVTADSTGGPYQYSANGIDWQDSSTITGLKPGLQKIRVRNLCGYGDTTVLITVPPVLRDTLVYQESAHCKALGRAVVEGRGGVKPYQYQLDGGPWQPTGVFPQIPVGSHVLTVRDSNGCEKTRPLVIADFSQPIQIVVDSSSLTGECKGRPSFMAVSGAGGTPQYNFSLDGALSTTVGIFENLPVGPHSIEISDEYGCTGPPLNFMVSASIFKLTDQKATICEGEKFNVGTSEYATAGVFIDSLKTVETGCDSIVTTDLTVLKNTSRLLEATICEGEEFAAGSFSYSKTGLYKEILPNTDGCDSTLTTRLTVLDTVLFIRRYNLCDGDSLQLDGKIYTRPGRFTKTLAALNGCDSTALTIIEGGGSLFCDSLHCRLYVPNAFSPNGDGENDEFEAFSPVVELSEMQVFDRTGSLIFEEKSNHPRWSGENAAGRLLQPGVFVWVLRGMCDDGRVFLKKGDVALLR